MSSEFCHYTGEEFLEEFFPDPADKADIAAGMEQLRAEQHTWRLETDTTNSGDVATRSWEHRL